VELNILWHSNAPVFKLCSLKNCSLSQKSVPLFSTLLISFGSRGQKSLHNLTVFTLIQCRNIKEEEDEEEEEEEKEEEEEDRLV
jgi:hypothetical protein